MSDRPDPAPAGSNRAFEPAPDAWQRFSDDFAAGHGFACAPRLFVSDRETPRGSNGRLLGPCLIVPRGILTDEPREARYRLGGYLRSFDISRTLLPIARGGHPGGGPSLAMPALVDAYDHWIVSLGLPRSELMATSSPTFGAGVNPVRNTIVLGPHILGSPIEEILAGIGHEYGHLFEPDDRSASSEVAKEDAADEVSVALTGRARPLATWLRNFDEAADREIAAGLADPDPDIRRRAGIREDYRAMRRERTYGPLGRRLERLEDMDPPSVETIFPRIEDFRTRLEQRRRETANAGAFPVAR